MKKQPEEMTVVMQEQGIEILQAEWGEMQVCQYTLAPGTDLSPFFEGLPDGLCPVRHWGRVLEGEIHLRYSDGTEELTRAGEFYHWPAGHTAWTETGVVFIAIHPAEEENRAEELMAAQQVGEGREQPMHQPNDVQFSTAQLTTGPRLQRHMNESRIHRAVSADGTEIVGRVHGQGPPLVLLPAGPGDSETSWRFLLPFLSERFTCYLMDTRGRGLSAENPDHSPQRLVQDVTAFAESIGKPVGLVEWGTVLWALVAAENSTAISAVAAYEPGADEVMSEEVASHVEEVFARVGKLAAEGRLVDAARTVIENSNLIYTDEEVAHGAPSDFWVASAPNILVFLQEQQQAAEAEQPGPTDPSVLARITVPVLLLHGSRSRPWFADSVRHVAQHVNAPIVHQISGAAHFGPYLKPRTVVDELIRFFSAAQQPAPRQPGALPGSGPRNGVL